MWEVTCSDTGRSVSHEPEGEEAEVCESEAVAHCGCSEGCAAVEGRTSGAEGVMWRMCILRTLCYALGC